jgi:hypothetical protein
MNKFLEDLDVGDVAALALTTLVFVVGVVGIAALLMPHEIDYYYFGSGDHTSTCVYSHWSWHPDERVFCSDSYDRAVDFTTKANDSLEKRAK